MEIIGNSYIAKTGEDQMHVNRYVFAGQLLKENRAKLVLDAACMHGYGSFILSHFIDKIVAIDIDKNAVIQAKKEYASDNIEYRVDNCLHPNFSENYFDGAVCFEIIEHLDEDEQRKFLSILKKIVKPYGLIIISTPDRFIGKPKIFKQEDHKKELTKDELNNLLGLYFNSHKFYGQFRLKQNVLIPMFLRRLILGVVKRAFRSSFGKRIGLSNFLDYKIYSLSENETAAALLVVCKNQK